VNLDLERPGVEVEDFVADVRPAYERAAIVIAPLQVSAGTNLKLLEAMALEKPVVSTPAGVNGLDLAPGEDFILVHDAAEMAHAIEELMNHPEECERLGAAARRRVERQYNWEDIARRQTELYHNLLKRA
jgi:glycosyltransferase involved in cell wall biosynthesis